jgi:hypothetical protein
VGARGGARLLLRCHAARCRCVCPPKNKGPFGPPFRELTRARYCAIFTMWSTASFTNASGASVRPPLAGIIPALPVKPCRACW